MKKLRRILTLVFALVGAVFLLVSAGVEVWFSLSTAGMQTYSGVIAELHSGDPVIEYTVDGTAYRLEGSSRSSFFRIGDAYSVLADPDAPARAFDPGQRIVSLVFCIIGFAMMAAAAIIHVLLMRKERQLDVLRSCGLRAEGAVTRVYMNRSVQVNNRSPWVVEAECLHPHTRERVTAKSTWLWQTSLQPGDRVDVLFDPMNDRLRMVDADGEDA